MNKSLTLKNVYSSVFLQLVTIINGLVVPRIVLVHFGSDVNGLVSSITQLLSYITIFEGGIGAVIMSALYKPLAENDWNTVSSIIVASRSFFRKLGILFIAYVLVLSFIGSKLLWNEFDYYYVVSLIIIISLHLFIQYYYSVSYKILLNADRKVFIVSSIQTVFVLLNLLFSIIVALVYPEIHLLKLVNIIAYIVQPLFFYWYTKRNYDIDLKVSPNLEAIEQRWDGFGQNLSYVIGLNTDITVLTVFSTLSNVSIYSVFNLVIIALKNLVGSVSSAIVPTMGRSLVSNSKEEIEKVFNLYESSIGLISSFLFTSGACLINRFVRVYTLGINDANYNQPMFGVILMLAIFISSVRDPYINIANAAGHFKKIARYSYFEVLINIVVSISLVFKYGLLGVAFGTLISSLYRYGAQIIYLNKNIINRPIWKAIKSISSYLLIFIFGYSISICIDFGECNDYKTWLIYALITIAINTLLCTIICYFFHKELFYKLIYRSNNSRR